MEVVPAVVCLLLLSASFAIVCVLSQPEDSNDEWNRHKRDQRRW